MNLGKVTLKGFRCFEQPVTVEFDDLTAFVGTNGTGKTAVLMALARMFGTTNAMRALTKDDFYRSPDTEEPDQLDLEVEAWFEFPELLDDEAAAESTAIPECLRNILADDSDEVPTCRIRLRATWTNTPSAEGDIEQHLEWVGSLEDEPPEDSVHKLGSVERSLIQVYYVPAARDAVRELRVASGSILSRSLRLIEWKSDIRDTLLELSTEMTSALKSEKALTQLESTLQESWRDLRGPAAGQPELSVADTELETLLRRIDARIALSKNTGRHVDLLSEGRAITAVLRAHQELDRVRVEVPRKGGWLDERDRPSFDHLGRGGAREPSGSPVLEQNPAHPPVNS